MRIINRKKDKQPLTPEQAKAKLRRSAILLALLITGILALKICNAPHRREARESEALYKEHLAVLDRQLDSLKDLHFGPQYSVSRSDDPLVERLYEEDAEPVVIRRFWLRDSLGRECALGIQKTDTALRRSELIYKSVLDSATMRRLEHAALLLEEAARQIQKNKNE